MPELIDTHLHFFDFRVVTDPVSLAAFVQDQVPPLLGRILQYGITAIKSVGDPAAEILEACARIAAGTPRGPQLLTTGLGRTGGDGVSGADSRAG